MEETKWLIFQFRTTHEAALAIDNFLLAYGAAGVTTIDKTDFLNTFKENSTPDLIVEDFLNSLDSEVIIEAYFPTTANQLLINRELNISEPILANTEKIWIYIQDFENMIEQSLQRISEFLDIGKGYIGYKLLKEQNWAENWKKFYDTLKIGRIVVNPSWLEYEAENHEIVLNLDPGSAFGTGDHESTALVLQYLSDWSFENIISGPILDLGTGSGILAIAARKIFPDREIFAIDIDQHSIGVAENNSRKNQVQINFSQGELKDLNEKFCLILANLIASIHTELAEHYLEKLLAGGYLIASGIIGSRVEEVKLIFKQAGFILIDESTSNDWSALIYQKAP